MARAMHSRCCCPPDSAVPLSWRRSLTSSHRPARFSDLLDDRARARPCRTGEAVDARAVGDILEDRLGERIGLLEHHPDAGAQLNDVHVGAVDVLAVELDAAGHPGRRDGVVHPVEAAQEGRLAAARRADERGDAIVVDVDRDVLQRLLVAVEDADLVGAHLGRRGRRSGSAQASRLTRDRRERGSSGCRRYVGSCRGRVLLDALRRRSPPTASAPAWST